MVGLPNGSQGPIDDMPQFPTAFPTREQFQDAGPEIGSGQKAVQEEAGPEERDGRSSISRSGIEPLRPTGIGSSMG